jgi:hypothetical protein
MFLARVATLNVFFPMYVAALIAAALALIAALSSISPSTVARRFDVDTPARLIGVYFASIGVVLACASLYLVVLSVNSTIFVVRGLSAPPGEIAIWSTVAAATSAATVVLFAHAERPGEA